jgi:hypothetical protein
MALTAFRDAGEPAGLLLAAPGTTAEDPSEALTEVDRQLLSQYIAGAVHLHDKAGRYRPADVQRWLTALADGLAWQARHAGSGTDIELATWWAPRGRWMARLAHGGLPFLPALALSVLIGFLTPGLAAGPLAAAVVLALMAMRSPAPRRVGLRHLITWRGLARLIGSLALGTALGFTLAFVSGFAAFFGSSSLTDWLQLGLLSWLAYGLVVGTIAGAVAVACSAAAPWAMRRLGVRSRAPRGPGVRRIITWRTARRFGAGFALGLGLALVAGLLTSARDPVNPVQWGVVTGVAAGSLLGILYGLVYGFIFGLMAGLASGLANTTPRPVGPRDALRGDARYLLTVAAVPAVLLGLATGLVIAFGGELAGEGWSWAWLLEGLGLGAVAGAALGLWFGVTGAGGRGSSACTRYLIAVVISRLRGRAPLRFGVFLDWARDAGLLRVSGVAYQFRHRQLQEWLASRDDTSVPARVPASVGLPELMPTGRLEPSSARPAARPAMATTTRA